MERTAHHAMAVRLHAVHLSHLPNGDGGLDSLIQAQGHSSFVSCVAPETPKWEGCKGHQPTEKASVSRRP